MRRNYLLRRYAKTELKSRPSSRCQLIGSLRPYDSMTSMSVISMSSVPGISTIIGLLRSPSLQSAIMLGVGGVAFSLTTLLLARYLPARDFGLLTLLLALIQVGIALGPAGLDLLVNRLQLAPSKRVAFSLLTTSTFFSSCIVAVAWHVYDVSVSLLIPLWIAIVAAAVNQVGSSFFQSRKQFYRSLGLMQIHNFVFLATVLLARSATEGAVQAIIWIVGLAYLSTSLLGWVLANRVFHSGTNNPTFKMRDGLNGVGIIFAVHVFSQTERITIPLVLSLEDMATFGVLAAVVVAPFRMLQLAVGYTLLPRLRAAEDLPQAKNILRAEIRLALQVGLLAAAAVYWVGPLVISLIVGDKYVLDGSLLAAAIGVGWVRLVQSISVATVNSLGDSLALQVLNVWAWLALGLALAGAFVLGRFGLTGIVLGVGCGWVALSFAGLILAVRSLDRHFQNRPQS